MTAKKVKFQIKGKAINPVIVAVAGAVTAGVAVAGALIMSDKKNQDKVNKAISNVKNNLNKKKVSIINKVKKI